MGKDKEKEKIDFYQQCLDIIKENMPIGEAFDLIERKMVIGGKEATAYFIDGLTDGQKCQLFMAQLYNKTEETMKKVHNSKDFLKICLPFMDAQTVQGENAYDAYMNMLPKLYAGLVPLIVEGLDEIIIIDCRDYPLRSIEEPDKEKSLRGAKDGFGESMMNNVALIRRRIRDNHLIFKAYNIGQLSKADVAIAYMDNKADKKLIKKLDDTLKNMGEYSKEYGSDSYGEKESYTKCESKEMQSEKQAFPKGEQVEEVALGDQSILETLMNSFNGKSSFNPFPKVRYSQRPDVIAAHINEGKIAIIVDNSPTVMLVPVSVFEFFQDVDDYYFPKLTGNYFRLLRIVNFFVILFLIPVYFLFTEYDNLTPDVLEFFVPKEAFAIPIFWQFILLETAIDALKLASLNTPTSLGMSLSVIGALILGEFSIESGWFVPQTILCMAVVALAAFTQPSIELSYAMKFWRIALLIGAAIFGIWGVAAVFILGVVTIASTKTLSGESYLYPLVPFDGKALKRLIFRTQK